VSIIETGISPKYVKDWGVVFALRELVQNWADVRDEFNCKGTIRWANGYAHFRDYGPGLEMRHLVMGISEKGEDTIGTFGEGLKLAALVLAREGRKIVIRTKDIVLSPTIVHSSTFGIDVLAYYKEINSPATVGTDILVECSEEELDEAKSFFARFTPLHWLVKDKLSTPGGRLYVNGAIVAELPDALFSYHVKRSESGIICNRDRTVVSMTAAETVVSDYILEEMAPKEIRSLLDTVAHDTVSVFESKCEFYNRYTISFERHIIIKEAFEAIFGTRTLIGTGNDDEIIAKYLGYDIEYFRYGWARLLASVGIQSSNDVINDLRYTQIEDLTEENKSLVERAKNKVQNLFHEELPRIIIVDKIINGGSRNIKAMYDGGDNTVVLARQILEDPESILPCILHEAAHWASNSVDLTSEFENMLTRMCGVLMQIVYGGTVTKIHAKSRDNQ
jgi:hypothetical protein